METCKENKACLLDNMLVLLLTIKYISYFPDNLVPLNIYIYLVWVMNGAQV